MEPTTEYIGGIEVTFPFKPYGLQKAYMSKVVSSVSESKNALLESPTGTGKTLSLLCSSLAWLKLKREQETNAKKNEDTEVDMEDMFPEKEKVYKKYMKESLQPKDWKQKGTRIVYSSRTHVQLSQAIGEMKKTNYTNMKGVVLGSRDQYCLNSDVTRLDNIAAKNHACRVKNNHQSCPYYSRFESKLYSTSDYTAAAVHDIEDLVSLGKRHTLCPYYASKSLAQRADIIFVPYNYLIDKQSRKSQEVGLKDAVVIIDEGHNIERSLEETASTDLSSQSLASCIKYMNTLYEELNGEADSEVPVDENVMKSLRHMEVKDVLNLKTWLCDFEDELDKFIASVNEEKVFFPDALIYRILDKAYFDWGYMKTIDDIITYLVARSAFSPSVTVVISALHRMEHFLKAIYPDDVVSGDMNLDLHQVFFAKNFKVFAVKNVTKNNGWYSKTHQPDKGWTLNVMCLTPSVAMHSLLNCGVRSCIITSGTLAPLDTFEAELNVKFPIILQNKHIIKATNLKVLSIGTGQFKNQNEPFNSTYNNRENDKYYGALGDAISKYVQLIPGGVFLFFSSYTLMDKCVNHWKRSWGGTYWDSIAIAKQVFIESKNKLTFEDDVKKFKSKIDEPGSNGALFLGVCRGKLSEGMDAADQYCRAVIVAGLPYPAQYEPRVLLKKKYLDENKATTSMSSSLWYQLQMTRAVNQAIGRIIRHKDDYGVVILLDSRFSQRKRDLSSWIRDYFNETSLSESLSVIKTFFKDKITYEVAKAPEPEKLGLQPGVRRPHEVSVPLNSTLLHQYREEIPRKRERLDAPKNIFELLKTGTTSNAYQPFKTPAVSRQTFVSNISPIVQDGPSRRRHRHVVPLITIQPTVVDEKPTTQNFEEMFQQKSVELKELFKGTDKFTRLCKALQKYKFHRIWNALAHQIKWLFEGINEEIRNRNLLVISLAITNTEHRKRFLDFLKVKESNSS